jgi:hypothetical protein
MHLFRSLTHLACRLKPFNVPQHATLPETSARHPPKVGTMHSHRGNFSPIPSPLLHRCNTFRVFENESERWLRSSLVFQITPAQDHF